MALASGTRLGPYEILAPIGAGGMGEVYKARDTRLDRTVAIKVLPEELSTDPERVARFEREAKLLASLNHPNIAGIYGFETQDGVNAIVLELIEGPTLAERIEQGPIPVDEAIAIAKQIAEALEAGHEAGVIHRDLKPANIKLKEDGTVKVLDYGLAKALEGEPPAGANSELSQSPTLTRQGTQIGVVLGTAAYMSPEQARGKPVDKRSDIWSFGAVLYEVLAGRPAFEGETVSDVLAAVLRADVDTSRLPEETPTPIERLLRRCLTRDPRARLQHVGDARLEIDDAAVEPERVAPEQSSPRPFPWLVVAAVAVVFAGVGALSMRAVGSSSSDLPVRRFTVPIETTEPIEDRLWSLFAVSPDGLSLIFGHGDQFHRLSLDRLDAVPIPGTGYAQQPFYSPDGAAIAFHQEGTLRALDLDDGSIRTVVGRSAFHGMSGGVWTDDGAIVFAEIRGGLRSVSAAGGVPVLLKSAREQEWLWPDVLPGGQGLLASSRPGFLGGAGESWRIWAIPLQGGDPVPLTTGEVGRYVPTGHLVFQRGDTLHAQRFDPERFELIGSSQLIADGLLPGSFVNRAPQWDFSSDGTLVYARQEKLQARNLLWVDRTGSVSELAVPAQQYLSPKLSPDGRRVALAISPSEGGGRELWTLALDTGAFTRLTFGNVLSTDPVWSPDGTMIAFAQAVGGSTFDVVTQSSTGIAQPVRRTDLTTSVFPRAWIPGAQTLLVERLGPRNLGTLTLDSENTLEIDERTYAESQPAISPDGSLVVYASRESGEWEIFLRSFPDGGQKWQLSSKGGREPLFSADGHEVFYRDESRMMVVPIETEPDLRIGAPRALFEGRYARDPFGGDSPNYDVAPDGRFLMIQGSEAGAEVVVVLNWYRELERLVPTK